MACFAFEVSLYKHDFLFLMIFLSKTTEKQMIFA